MWNKIQKIFVWTNLVRPKWKPWANTLAYYPLTATDTVNDMSWNWKNLTNTWVTFGTVWNVSCATFNGSSYLNRSESLFTWSPDFTVNLWYKRTWVFYAHNNIFSVWTTSWTNSFIEWMYPNWANEWHLMVWWFTNDRDTWYYVPENTWLNLVFTHSWWTIKVYVNNSLKYTGTVSYTIQSWYTWVGCWIGNGNCMIWNLSNIIVENKVRTDTEISDYYDGTKSLYS